MKKLSVSLLVLIFTVLLCSCGIPALQRECFSVPENFICDIYVTENGIDYEGTLQREDGKYTLTVTSPENVSGLVVLFNDGKYFARFGGSETEITPENEFFMKSLIEFVECSIGNEEVEFGNNGKSYILKKDNFSLCFASEN